MCNLIHYYITWTPLAVLVVSIHFVGNLHIYHSTYGTTRKSLSSIWFLYSKCITRTPLKCIIWTPLTVKLVSDNLVTYESPYGTLQVCIKLRIKWIGVDACYNKKTFIYAVDWLGCNSWVPFYIECQNTQCQKSKCQNTQCQKSNCQNTQCQNTRCQNTRCRNTRCQKTRCQNTGEPP